MMFRRAVHSHVDKQWSQRTATVVGCDDSPEERVFLTLPFSTSAIALGIVSTFCV